MSRVRFSAYEFVLVIGVAFGWAILVSVGTVLQGPAQGGGSGDTFGIGHLYGVVVTELICFPIVAAILWSRGWRLADFPIAIGKAATVLGIVIALGSWGFDTVLSAAFEAMFPRIREVVDVVESYRPRRPPDLVAIYILSVINPVFEEVIVCGYVIPVLAARFGQTTAINVSVVIRCSYHLYQGIAAVPYHLAYGLIQAYVFVRYKNLWPLIVSHAVLDFAGLLYFL